MPQRSTFLQPADHFAVRASDGDVVAEDAYAFTEQLIGQVVPDDTAACPSHDVGFVEPATRSQLIAKEGQKLGIPTDEITLQPGAAIRL
jgi:glyoxylase-like metal-dependent hydrolase (beta-lactamase superfamily II)